MRLIELTRCEGFNFVVNEDSTCSLVTPISENLGCSGFFRSQNSDASSLKAEQLDSSDSN